MWILLPSNRSKCRSLYKDLLQMSTEQRVRIKLDATCVDTCV